MINQKFFFPGKAPYSSVITHGFVLDEKGMKMSKSVGNVVDPENVISGGKNQKVGYHIQKKKKILFLILFHIIIPFFLLWQDEPGYGADVLRLWVSSVDYSGDVLIGPQILRQMSDIYRKLRGTLRYLLSNLHDWRVHSSCQTLSPFIFTIYLQCARHCSIFYLICFLSLRFFFLMVQ